ncbi:MAG: RHS repeat protein, partial [Akkermansia sp.]|nr:RHS repeat protein [Akkermansia sp.]
MIKQNHTKSAGALDSEGVPPSTDFTFTQSASPIGFSRISFTEPPLPGSDWDTVFSGVCVDLMNQAAVTHELVLKGDKLVLSRPTQLAVCLTVDDHGDLLISDTELADDTIAAAFAAAPQLHDAEALVTTFSGSVCLHTDLQGTEWQDFDSGAAAWKRPVRTLVLPAGEYFIYGRITNDPMKGGNANNRKLFRYAIQAKQACGPVEFHGSLPQVCNTCGCGNTTDGDADRHAATQAPGWEGDVCPSFVTLNPATGKALYDSPWRWKAAIAGAQVVITPPVGEALFFAIPAENASEAATTGSSGMAINRIQYQDGDFHVTTSRTPAFIMMKDADGLCMTFDMSNGCVYSIISPEGRKVTATDRAQHVQTQFDGEGNLLFCASAEAKLVCTSADNGDLQLTWFTPDAAEDATPFKQETIQRNGNDTTLTRQQTGRDPHSLVRSENNGVVTITKGEGDEAIVHRYETMYPMNGLMVRTESVYFTSTPDKVATCTRSVYNYSAAGWQLYSVTAGFGSDVAQTTSYFYSEDNRLAKQQRADGGITEYEYDSLGRLTMEKSPWAANLAKVTRTTYAEARFFEVRPATVAEYHLNASGAEVLFRNTAYSYEDSAELERTTISVTAGGSILQQISIDETFGPEPDYAYAAGKPKFSQDIAGVQTVHEYAATTEHGAIHKHTTITMANGELVAAHSRKTEQFIAADDTITFEQESIWDGTQWLLLDTTAYEYDAQQRVVKTTRGNGRFSTTEWMCCGRLSETDEDGITTTYAYDSARNLTETTREAVYEGETCITPETITEFARDAAGRVLST